MAYSWFIYSTVAEAAATRAIEATYKALAAIVGEDLAEHLEPGEELEPPSLGSWPEISMSEPPSVPTPEAQRATLTAKGKVGATFEEAALDRLAKCVSSIRIEPPQDFDPAHVSALRALIGKLGPCVFTKGEGLDLSTSETLLSSLADRRDLPSALAAVEAGELGEDDEDEDEDEDDEPASDSARPEVLRRILAEIAQHPRARRKAGELLATAPEIVGAFAERLARVGAEPDPAVAKALEVKEREVLVARKALALILRRAEGR